MDGADNNVFEVILNKLQNKLHYAAHGNTASEVVFLRVDSDKPFAGLTNFKGDQPTQAEAMIAKKYESSEKYYIVDLIESRLSKAFSPFQLDFDNHINIP